MGVLRWILRFYFGIQALYAICRLPVLFALWREIEIPQNSEVLFYSANALVLLLCVVPAMACWTLGKGKPSARWWAIAASLLGIVGVGPVNQWFSIAMGIAGLAAFATPNVEVRASQRIAGDGTSRITEYAAMAIGLSGYLCGMYLWVQWGKQQGLSGLGFTAELLISQVALLLETACHELGHVLAGRMAGMVLWSVRVGPINTIAGGHYCL